MAKMISLNSRTIYVTQSDKAELEELLDFLKTAPTRDQQYANALEQELDVAEVVAMDDLPPDVITMNSQVRIRDLDTGASIAYTLVFPQDSDISKGRISILAPIGTAMLGYRVGDIIEWKVPAGTRRLKVESVSYPSAAPAHARDYTPAGISIEFSRRSHDRFIGDAVGEATK